LHTIDLDIRDVWSHVSRRRIALDRAIIDCLTILGERRAAIAAIR
jgi:hypothetical protein